MIDNQIIKDNVKLIYKIAGKFYGVEKEDLYQAGITGLLKAYKNYDQKSEAKFSTFAYKYILGEMYLLANKKMISINRDTLKIYKLVEKTRYVYAQKLGHLPNNSEIAKILNLNEETVDYACLSSVNILSMDNENDEERSMYETIYKEEAVNQDDKILLYESINMLPEAEKQVIFERYFRDETQTNLANKLNTSQVKISRLEKSGLTRIRKILETC